MPEHDLSANQVEQTGRILTPIIQQAISPKFHELRNDVNAMFMRHSAEARERHQSDERRFECIEENIKSTERRVATLELRWAKIIGIWIGVSVFTGILTELVKFFLSR